MVSFFSSQPHINPIFGIAEITNFLEGLKYAAILLENKQIFAVNAKVIELTAYTRQELIGKNLEEIVILKKDDDKLQTTQDHKRPTTTANLTTRNYQKITTFANMITINDGWQLIIFEPLKTPSRKHLDYKEQNKTLQLLGDLLQILKINNVEAALFKALEIGRDILDASALAIYVGNNQKPGANRITFSGKSSLFPPEILPSDLSQLIDPTMWIRGQRSILTILQQGAQVTGLNFLATYPIRDVESFIGILVAGGFHAPNTEQFMQTMRLLSELLAIIVNKNILISNLWNNVQKYEENLSILKSLKNITSDGIATVSTSLTLIELNKAAELILGYGNHEIAGAEIDQIFVGTDRIIPALQLALQGITTPNLGEILLHRRDGSQFPAEVSTIPIHKQNKTIGAFVIIRDKSESEQMRVRTQQLEQRALLGEVTAVFAHEVRNPINNISTGLQLVSEELSDSDPNQDVIRRMLSDCSRLTDLMESVLMFSRSGNYKLIPLNIGDLITKLVNQWSSRMNRLRIEHHLNIPSSLFVEGDRRALEQVFANLISNAIQAMENLNGGILAIKGYQEEIENKRYVIQIDVSDTGLGIPKESMPRIFEPFFTTKKNGTGLGLAITKQIITAHKGSIQLTTFPGGTVFHVRLPSYKPLEIFP